MRENMSNGSKRRSRCAACISQDNTDTYQQYREQNRKRGETNEAAAARGAEKTGNDEDKQGASEGRGE
jgi:transglutaminase/protease-like cytokinesis protein 3